MRPNIQINKTYIIILQVILSILIIFEKIGKEVYDYEENGVILLFEFNDIKHIFNLNSLNFKVSTGEPKKIIEKSKKFIQKTNEPKKNNPQETKQNNQTYVDIKNLI